jgi:hypothetical protein
LKLMRYFRYRTVTQYYNWQRTERMVTKAAMEIIETKLSEKK